MKLVKLIKVAVLFSLFGASSISLAATVSCKKDTFGTTRCSDGTTYKTDSFGTTRDNKGNAWKTDSFWYDTWFRW